MKAISLRWIILTLVIGLSLLLVSLLLQGPSQFAAAAARPLLTGPGCAGTPMALWADDFEAGVDDWISTGLTTTWNLSSFRVHDGVFSMRAVDLSSISDQRLLPPAVVLPPAGMGPIELSFWHYQLIEDGPGRCFDGAAVEYSIDGGGSWQTFTSTQLLTDPYDGRIDENFGNPMAGEQAWCGDPQDWLAAVVDLSDLAGETVHLRFRLATDKSNGREGWYIDTVAINACLPSSGYGARLSPARTLLTLLPTEMVTHTFTLENLGAADSYNVDISGAVWATDLTSANAFAVAADMTETITVRVTAPALVATDSFTLTVISANDPSNIHMEASGQTSASYNRYLPTINRP